MADLVDGLLKTFGVTKEQIRQGIEGAAQEYGALKIGFNLAMGMITVRLARIEAEQLRQAELLARIAAALPARPDAPMLTEPQAGERYQAKGPNPDGQETRPGLNGTGSGH